MAYTLDLKVLVLVAYEYCSNNDSSDIVQKEWKVIRYLKSVVDNNNKIESDYHIIKSPFEYHFFPCDNYFNHYHYGYNSVFN